MSFKGIPKRYVLSMLIFWGFFIMYAIRTNINVAIGAMLKNHTVLVDGVETEQVSDLQEFLTSLTLLAKYKPAISYHSTQIKSTCSKVR